MKILLDENLPHTLRRYLPQFETFTAAYVGLAGLTNGHLLAAGEAAGFDVLVTGDQTLKYEQNLSGRKIAVVALSAISWPIMQPYLEKIVAAIHTAKAGSVTLVQCGVFSRSGPTPND